MNLLNVLNFHILIILLYLTKSECFDKFVPFKNSIKKEFQLNANQMIDNQFIAILQFEVSFNSPPQILLGIKGYEWGNFQNNENEFSLSIETKDQKSAKIICSSQSSSSNHFNQILIMTFSFVSDEALIQMIVIEESDIIRMSSNGSSPKTKQFNKLFSHQLLKKPHSKRNIQCFIIGYKQEFSTIPPQSDSILSFFVESIGDFSENKFQLTFTTLDQQDTLKRVNINCIEYYQYDQYFQPNEFIKSIYHSKYENQQLERYSSFDFTNKEIDFIYDDPTTFYGFNGMDLLFNGKLYIILRNAKGELNYYSLTQYRAVTSSFIQFKMYNCPQNCEDCSDQQTCQKCKLKFILNINGICIPCNDNCLSCDLNLFCLICQEPYYNYKGKCYYSQPKNTYCVSKSIYPPF